MSDDRTSATLPDITKLQRAADQCVKCAVCLPHCPTYAIDREEAESPRGRITLLQGIVHGRLVPTSEVHAHLDSCLSCGRCEQVCPANVPYTRLLDGTRAHMNHPQDLLALSSAAADHYLTRPSFIRRIMARLLSSGVLLKGAHSVARMAMTLGLSRRLGQTRAGRLLNSLPQRQHPAAATRNQPRATVSPAPPSLANASSGVRVSLKATLFTGCLSDTFEVEAANAVTELAAAYGIQLNPTPAGLCCGALYQHQGDSRATTLARAALTALRHTPPPADPPSPATADPASAADDSGEAPKDTPVVALQSGCRRGLSDGLRSLSDSGAQQTANRLVDVFDLLERAETAPAFRPTTDRVALYAPCSFSQTASRCLDVMTRDLTAIDTIDRGHGCCGAAGDHMVTNPARADQLVRPIVNDILTRGYSHVLTPNAGCAWHLRASLRAQGVDVVVEHPVTWMARHLIPAGVTA